MGVGKMQASHVIFSSPPTASVEPKQISEEIDLHKPSGKYK